VHGHGLRMVNEDVREEYRQRHKAHHEANFSALASVGAHVAKQKFREWDASVSRRKHAMLDLSNR